MRKASRFVLIVGMVLFVIMAVGDKNPLAAGIPHQILEKLDDLQESINNLVQDEPRIPISSLPYTIDSPGSYYLTEDLTASGDGIIVTVDDVTIDLNGFSLKGGTGDGIHLEECSNIEIRNGTVRNFVGNGIHDPTYYKSTAYRVIGVRLLGNQKGIALPTVTHCLIKDCTAVGNSADGIHAGRHSLITGNICNNNAMGIHGADGHCVIDGNICFNNTSTAMHAGGNATVTNNTLAHNNGGMTIAGSTLVRGNRLTANSAFGVHVLYNKNVIEENMISDSTDGIYFVTSGNFYDKNRFTGNTNNVNEPSPGDNKDGGGNVSF